MFLDWLFKVFRLRAFDRLRVRKVRATTKIQRVRIQGFRHPRSVKVIDCRHPMFTQVHDSDGNQLTDHDYAAYKLGLYKDGHALVEVRPVFLSYEDLFHRANSEQLLVGLKKVRARLAEEWWQYRAGKRQATPPKHCVPITRPLAIMIVNHGVELLCDPNDAVACPLFYESPRHRWHDHD